MDAAGVGLAAATGVRGEHHHRDDQPDDDGTEEDRKPHLDDGSGLAAGDGPKSVWTAEPRGWYPASGFFLSFPVKAPRAWTSVPHSDMVLTTLTAHGRWSYSTHP
jgi:hypothetical protein